MTKSLFIRSLSLFFMLAKSTPQNAQVVKSNDRIPTKKECVALLTNAMKNAETIFIKVHAAEALIFNNYYQGIDACFKKLVKEPGNLIVASRVLARTNKKDPAKYNTHVNTLLYQLENADSVRGKLIALESLSKIGFKKPIPAIKNYADTGTNGFKAMARWTLANSGKAEDEDRLASLLSSKDPADYRTAAYALRFFKKIKPSTLQLLRECANRMKLGQPERIFILSTLFVHVPDSEISGDTKEKLLGYLSGSVAERYQLGETFAEKGTQKDIQALQKLLADENMDVRVAAAKAMLSIFSK